MFGGQRGCSPLEPVKDLTRWVVTFFQGAQEPVLAKLEIVDGAAEGLDLVGVCAGLV